jgi:hypothetical protein
MASDQLAYRKLSSFSLTLHGWNERFPAEQLLPSIERYFSRAGVEPQEGCVKGTVPPELKCYSMRTIRKRIAIGQISGLNNLSLHHFTDRKYKPSDDFYISYDTTYGDETCQFVNAVSPEAERYDIALAFLRDMLTYVTPSYGYSLDMPLGYDPALFAVGMFSYSDDIQDEVHAWQRSSSAALNGFAHKQGRLRHVFAINILSRPHMEARVDGKSFGEWVRGPNRGSIEEWKDGVWVWQVPKEHRIKIASILHFNGMLTAPDGFQSRLIG